MMKDTDDVEAGAGNEEATEDAGKTSPATVAKAKRFRRLSGRDRTAIVAAVALVAIAGTIIFVWWLRSRESGAGRPVPAPRQTVETGQPQQTGATMLPTESTLTVSPDTIKRSGIKIEIVGEQMGADAGGGTPATGVVKENSYRTTPLVSLVGGILRAVNGELGQTVRRGQTLAVVFSNDLAMAQSRYLTALADLEEHHLHHRRTLRLVDIGAASREELEQATTKLRTAESDVASLRQQLLLLGLSSQRISALRTSTQVSSEVSLPAPVSGTIVSRTANPGEVIEANKELLRVADLSSVWVIGQLYEKDLAKIRVGSGANITSSAYPDRVFRGQISYVDPALDPATRTAQVRIELANPGQALKIGMYVNIAFAVIGGSESTVPTVPSVAVQNLNNQQVVFVPTDDPNVFVMRPVRIGVVTNGRYPVLEGLNVGDRVVSEGSFMLRAEWLKLHPAGAAQPNAGASPLHQH